MRSSSTTAHQSRKAAGRHARSTDLFDKCRNFTRPGDLQAAGLYMYFEVFSEREGCGPGEVRMGNRKVLMFGSNDYLDLITHPKVKEAAVAGCPQVWQRMQRLAPAERHAGPAREAGSRAGGLRAQGIGHHFRHRFSGQLRFAGGAGRKRRRAVVRPQSARQPGGGRAALHGAHGALPPQRSRSPGALSAKTARRRKAS